MNEFKRVVHAALLGGTVFWIGLLLNWALNRTLTVEAQALNAWYVALGAWIGLGFVQPSSSGGET